MREGVKVRESECGQGLTEFALILPVLLMILIGAVDLGRAYSETVALYNASREGARNAGTYVLIDSTAVTTIKNTVIGEANGSGLTIQASDITIDCATYGSTSFSYANCATTVAGDQVRVTVSDSFSLVTTYILGLASVQLSGNTIMARSRP